MGKVRNHVVFLLETTFQFYKLLSQFYLHIYYFADFSLQSIKVDRLDKKQKSQSTKTKRNKWDYIKLKSFCTVKETINKLKGNLHNGRKYL